MIPFTVQTGDFLAVYIEMSVSFTQYRSLIDGLIFNCGATVASRVYDRTHGHGIYTQNEHNSKFIENIVIVDPFGGGLQIYGTDGKTNNYRVSQVILCNASLQLGGSQPAENLFADRIYSYGNLNKGIVSSVGYSDTQNVNDNLTDSIFAWRNQSSNVNIQFWDRLSFLRNTLYTRQDYGSLWLREQARRGWTWDHQIYHHVPHEARPPFALRDDKINEMDFERWTRQTGFDKASSFDHTLPAQDLRWFRLWEGAWAVAIYNLARADAVAVTLEFLEPGMTYRFRNAQDYFEDHWTATYADGDVLIDMVNRSVRTPFAASGPIWPWNPEFAVFVVEQV